MQSLDLVDTVTGAAFCLLLLPAANSAGGQPAGRSRKSLGLVHLTLSRLKVIQKLWLPALRTRDCVGGGWWMVENLQLVGRLPLAEGGPRIFQLWPRELSMITGPPTHLPHARPVINPPCDLCKWVTCAWSQRILCPSKCEVYDIRKGD